MKRGCFEMKLGFPETPIFGALLGDGQEGADPGAVSWKPHSFPLGRTYHLSKHRYEFSPSIFSQVESAGKPSTWRSRSRPIAIGHYLAISASLAITGSKRLRRWLRNWPKNGEHIGKNVQ
jgi:hypothetical protein